MLAPQVALGTLATVPDQAGTDAVRLLAGAIARGAELHGHLTAGA